VIPSVDGLARFFSLRDGLTTFFLKKKERTSEIVEKECKKSSY
jgi:hypothetical protein